MKQILFVLSIIGFVFDASAGTEPLFSIRDQAKIIREAEARGFRNTFELRTYSAISEITVKESNLRLSPAELASTGFAIANGTASDPLPVDLTSFAGALTDLATDFGDVKKWIVLGTSLWDVVKSGQPVLNVRTQTASVLPVSRPDWRLMEKWQGPMAKSYTIAAKNMYGATVVSHTYTVAYNYGGSFNGRGKFIANATIIPSQIDVAWGFTLNSQVKIDEPLNTGTVQDPVPGLGLNLEWAMSSIFKKTQGTNQFFVRGDGTTSVITLN